MTSFLDVDFNDESLRRREARVASVTAQARVEEQFGRWFREAGNNDELAARIAFAEDELEVLVPDSELRTSIIASYAIADQDVEHRTAAVHESRKPKMCPFHKDVVEISLNAGDPKAGFDALSGHWGGERHCEGGGYEGDKCNFKPQMTTQSYWDTKAEKAQERKERREQERAEQPETHDHEEITQEEVDVDVPVEADDPVDGAPVEEPADNVVDGDFGGADEAGEAAAEEVPMSMAAGTKQAAPSASPVMDKRKWNPTNTPFLDVDNDDGPNPTKRKDVIEAIEVNNTSEGLPEEIGEQVTEHVDLVGNDDGSFSPGGEKGQGGSWGQGGSAVTSSKADDVDKNPLVDLIESDYDGFLPQSEVQRAISAHRSR